MHHIEEWIATLPVVWVYVLVGGIIGIESMGIPVPGEIALVTASLLSVTTSVNPWLVAGSASAGAIIGDSIGYAIGRRGGVPDGDHADR